MFRIVFAALLLFSLLQLPPPTHNRIRATLPWPILSTSTGRLPNHDALVVVWSSRDKARDPERTGADERRRNRWAWKCDCLPLALDDASTGFHNFKFLQMNTLRSRFAAAEPGGWAFAST